MSRHEAAEALGVDLVTVDRLISLGVLRRYRLHDRYVRVRTEDVGALADVPRDWLTRC